MQQLKQLQNYEQQMYFKSKLIHNLQNYLPDNQKIQDCNMKSDPQDGDLFLKEQSKLKQNGLQNKPLHSLVVLYKNLQQKR
ncbi:unnamed protein product (macronuclear) [Paramecium tetraurelia]|uniref:Uncharacterized protein n=1 Tax=Paramecium tetraurelia TaxID=5888 RepID=A0DHY3_PARTE|nr:uncharacterized protein GSPATT00017021001 [Paramecium tetraurelia]CAK82650.1 unnamed protein product [Paramecium tetraurelia]|eukprot:XP_001450047.1 hypothetical protein (macronuclear) [Paramecium tetraurelia strain d4-2]